MKPSDMQGRIRKGDIFAFEFIVIIRIGVSRAKAILRQTGADDISVTSEAPADYAKSDKPLDEAVQSK